MAETIREHAEARLYTRDRGGTERWYADLRSAGGGREAMKPPGESRATADRAVALDIAVRRLEALEDRQARRHCLGLDGTAELAPYAAEYLRQRAREGKVAESTLSNLEHYLGAAVAFFGSGRDLTTVRAPDVRRWIAHLR